MIALAIASVNLRRTLRDRTNLFFLLLFPLLMILVLGLAFGGQTVPRLAVVAPSGGYSAELLADLRSSHGLEVTTFDTRDSAVRAVELGRAEGALLVPADVNSAVRAGRDVRLDYVSSADRTAQQMGTIVQGVVGQQSARLSVARVLQQQGGGSLLRALQTADATARAVPDVAVVTTTAGKALFPEKMGRFDLGASGELLLFVFITSMTASTALIESRKLGVSRRMFASPTPVRTIVAGEALGRLAVSVLQGALIMLGSSLLFGVSWGSPPLAALLMLAFAFVAGGAGLLMGSLASSTQQAVALGLLLALGMGSLGGSMMPLEFYTHTMSVVAHVTPHAWANEGFATLLRHDGGLRDIAGDLMVLLGYGAVLFAAAAVVLRRSLTRG